MLPIAPVINGVDIVRLRDFVLTAPVFAGKPTDYPWDRWEKSALQAGVSDKLANLGRSVFREAFQHDWPDDAKVECGWLDGGQTMQRMDFVNEEPRAQIAGPAHAKQSVYGNVHPQGQQRPIEHKVWVGRRDEKDRSFLYILGHPLVDREAGLTLGRLRQEAEYVGVRIEGCPDRFGHFCS